MYIAIDASRTTVARITGTERYALELIRAIIRQDQDDTIMLYFRDSPPGDLFPNAENVIYRIIPFRRAWTHVRFAAAIWQDRPDVTFVPAHTLPVAFPGRAVVTVHDLGYRHFPQAHTPLSRLYADWTTRYSAARASVVLADSQATADDLTRFYGTPADKIRVVYPGVDVPSVRPLDNLPPRYFLFLGTLHPRKNIARIVAAYARYRESVTDPAALVLAGGRGWRYDPAWVEGVDGVMLPGYVDEDQKGALYAGALGLVFATLYEGFGFPVIEAMHCGTPVITSTTSSLPELAGDAALLVDPTDVDAIAGAMVRLDQEPAVRERLRQVGYEQARQFTWDRAGKKALEAMVQQ
jgi:glycosyltransferase involved in cell wall biosynthesis